MNTTTITKAKLNELNMSSNDCLHFYQIDLNRSKLDRIENDLDNDHNEDEEEDDDEDGGDENISNLNNNNNIGGEEEEIEEANKLKCQQEKFNILKEILSSEKKYLNDIQEIVEVTFF